MGIDVNVDGYGGSIQTGNEDSISVRTENFSLELGKNILGRSYVKYSYVDNTGAYCYNKLIFNGPETAAVVLICIYAPNLAKYGVAAMATYD